MFMTYLSCRGGPAEAEPPLRDSHRRRPHSAIDVRRHERCIDRCLCGCLRWSNVIGRLAQATERCGMASKVAAPPNSSQPVAVKRWVIPAAVMATLALISALASAANVVVPSNFPSGISTGKGSTVAIFGAATLLSIVAAIVVLRRADRWRIGLLMSAVGGILIVTVTFGVGNAESRSIPAITLAGASMVAWLAVGSVVKRRTTRIIVH